jgi:hypothetical protein
MLIETIIIKTFNNIKNKLNVVFDLFEELEIRRMIHIKKYIV